MEAHIENAPAVWTTPQCPFTIEYTPRVLDDIRLAVMDAFFSLPRGGAEIGGILWGSHVDGRVTIVDYQALDCEHALGPGFTLSKNDKVRLAQLLAKPISPGLDPVGWYHSHTRSEIFLSEADLEIHRGFFYEPWQVALVMKPHTFNPPRVGFFFQGRDGSIHASESYCEFELEPLNIRQVPNGGPPMEVAPVAEPPKAPVSGKVITLAAEPAVSEPFKAEPVVDAAAAMPAPAPVENRPLPAMVLQPVLQPLRQAEPPAMRQAEPPAMRQAEPPAMRQAEPPAMRQAEPPAMRQAEPPAVRQAEQPAVRQTKPEPELPAAGPSEESHLAPAPEPAKIEPEEQPEEQPEAAAQPVPEADVPQFLKAAPSRSLTSRAWFKAVAAVAAGAALGVAAYLTRNAWLAPILAGFEHTQSAPVHGAAPAARPLPPPTIALSVLEQSGQLQIHWDQNSVLIRGASQAVLEISDSGSSPKVFPLDAAHLGSGSFTYARQGERVDIALAVDQADGKRLREITTFIGPAPVKAEDTTELHKRIDDLGRQNLQLLTDLKSAAERNHKLEKSVTDLQAQLHKQQRSRLENQTAK